VRKEKKEYFLILKENTEGQLPDTKKTETGPHRALVKRGKTKK